MRTYWGTRSRPSGDRDTIAQPDPAPNFDFLRLCTAYQCGWTIPIQVFMPRPTRPANVHSDHPSPKGRRPARGRRCGPAPAVHSCAAGRDYLPRAISSLPWGLRPAKCAAELRGVCCSWVRAAFGVLDDNVVIAIWTQDTKWAPTKTRGARHEKTLRGVGWQGHRLENLRRNGSVPRIGARPTSGFGEWNSIVVFEEGTIVRARVDEHDTG